jgi:hypothetical protein
VVSLPDAYLASLASTQIEAISPQGKPGHKIDLMTLVGPQVEEVAPGLLAKSRLLKPALQVDLRPDAWPGHLENMFGPRGFIASYEVPLEGRDKPDLLLVRIKARYEGDITVDGNPEIHKEDLVGLIQAYDYNQRDRSTGHNTTYSASVEGKNANSDDTTITGGLGTDRSRQVTAGSGEQNTTLDRTGHFDQAQVQRNVVFTSEVYRLHNAGAATMASPRWKLNQMAPAEHTTAAKPVQLRAQLNAMVPRPLIGPQPAGVAAPVPDEHRPEHRSLKMPEGAVVETAIPHGRGEKVTDELYDRLSKHLARRDVLGVAGLAEHQVAVETQLTPTALKAAFERLTSEDGLDMVPMAAPGNGRTTVAVVIHAKPTGWELDGDPLVDGQTGKVKRRQEATRSSTTGNHLLPATATSGASNAIVNIGGSIGEQVKEQTSDAHGTRLETSKFEEGDLVTVRVPVVYDVTVHQITDKGHGTPATKKTDHLPNAANAQFYLKMLKHEYLDGLRQLESGASVESVLAGAQLQAVPPKLGKPDMRATEYGQDKSGQPVHQPYRPLLNALAKAKAERTTVVLSVQEADGHNRLYQAFPNGTMTGVNDGGYAAAFATLHPRMALMAEGRVDLRKLFNSTQQQGGFSSKVADALEQSGVPTSILKGLDYSTTARQMAPAGGQDSTHTESGAAAGHTITPTGHGPSL